MRSRLAAGRQRAGVTPHDPGPAMTHRITLCLLCFLASQAPARADTVRPKRPLEAAGRVVLAPKAPLAPSASVRPVGSDGKPR